MVQILGIDKELYKEVTKGVYKISTFEEFQALDDFEVCVIDLNKKEIWENDENRKTGINCSKDLRNVKEAITQSKKCKIVIIFPQNLNYQYYYRSGSYYNDKEYLRNMRSELHGIIHENLIELPSYKICSERTITTINDCNINADFYFSNFPSSMYNVLSTSNNSDKTTTIKYQNVIATTLDLISPNNNPLHLKRFIDKYCREPKEKEEVPDWAREIKFFDDNGLIETKEENLNKIEDLKKKNIGLEQKLEKNMEYKSILYSSGAELVKTILEILDEILDNDSSAFVDEKKEDFLIKKEDVTFVGEIKGVAQSANNQNVSQLDVHVQGYKDTLEEKKIEENVKGLLIINHQRNKPLNERQKIHENQIKLAKRNGSLIIETTTLLKLFEKFKKKEITGEECKKIFTEEVGVLEIK